MANVVKHKFQSAKADGGDATKLRPNVWNDEHSFAGGALGSLLARQPSETDGADWIAAVATGRVLQAKGAGTMPAYSTATYPDTAARGAVLVASAANVIAALTIGSAGKILRSDGTDLVYSTFTIADTFAQGALPHASTTNGLTALAIGSVGHVLQVAGSPALPVWAVPYFHGHCRLTKNGSNLQLDRHNGRYLIINGVIQSIPSAGVTLAPSGASSGTTYYIYAFMSGSTMTLEFSATAPVIDSTTGVMVKGGPDATRSLVGMARAIAGPNWADTTAQRFVLSYFNRRNIYGIGQFTTDRTSTASPPAEVNSEIRTEFLTWGDEAFQANKTATVSNATGDADVNSYLNLDGATTLAGSAGSNAANEAFALPAVASHLASEGYHYVTVFGATAGGTTGTWHNDFCKLSVLVRG